MLSKRNFIMMFTMIIVVLALFLSSVVLKEYYNDYDVNHMAETEALDKKDSFFVNGETDGQVLYFGEEENGYFEVIKEWSEYRKKEFTALNSLDTVSSIEDVSRKYLLVDGGLFETNTEEYAEAFTEYVSKGGVVIFYRMPSYNTIRNCDALRNLLGIQRLRGETVKLQEIRLYSGFLLGGETHYSFDEASDPDLADMEREIPWYDISARTKTYMVGFLSAEEKSSLGINNEDMPAIIWRSNMENGSVFAVNGDYIKTAGIGILDAMLYESEEYSLYPVVNAQNLSVTGFPDLTNENERVMAEICRVTTEQFCRGILWPSGFASADKGNWKITSFISVKQNDSTKTAPKTDGLIDYLKYFNEESTEAGVSLGRINSSDIRASVKGEKAQLDKLALDYVFAAGYVRDENKDKLESLVGSNGNIDYFGDIRTVVGEYAENERIFYWLTDKITYQNVTADAYKHSYRDNLRLKSLETGLGYSNVQADIYRILNPENEKDQWENLADKMAANIDTYWKPFSTFDKTTVSQSDLKVRNFLNGKATSSKNGNTVTVKTENYEGEAYLLFRTHGEELYEMTGGSFKKIEDNAYLLTLTKDTAKISLKSEINHYYK